MFEETGIDISENVTIDRLGPYSFANKSSDKKCGMAILFRTVFW